MSLFRCIGVQSVDPNGKTKSFFKVWLDTMQDKITLKENGSVEKRRYFDLTAHERKKSDLSALPMLPVGIEIDNATKLSIVWRSRVIVMPGESIIWSEVKQNKNKAKQITHNCQSF